MNELDNYDNMCSICYEQFDENNLEYTLECNHKFHNSCIINWFRLGNSNCPLCNDKTLDISKMNYKTKIGTIKQIKQLGRRKNCPINIKKKLDKIKEINKENKLFNKEKKEFRKKHAKFIQEYKKYISWRSRSNFRKKIRKIEEDLLGIVQLNPIYL